MNSLEKVNVGIPKENRLIDGRAVQARILSEVREYVTQASAKFPIGRLVSISIGDHPEVAIYIRNQERAAEKTSIPFDQMLWRADITYEECKTRLVRMNEDPGIVGVIIQRPVPPPYQHSVSAVFNSSPQRC